MLRKFLIVFLCVSASLRVAITAEAQIRPVYDRGAMGLGQLLKRINTSASVLMIGAHPDDEDTALLAYLARGESARTAYLSLTRGDGGQNIIGPELGEALGVIRTEELLQARKLDGAEQYFTRAYDYGFSKTLDEARAKWDEKVILCDVVRVIRQFRPLVVVSQFSGTPADGHGHHQFSGYISPIAIKAAADASQCSDTGPTWTVKKFYVRHGFRATGEPKLRVNTGKYDPLLGRSYFEIAMEARSQHKSQEQGVLELRGDQYSGLNLVGSEAKESGIFEGLKTSIDSDLQSAAEAALREFDIKEPDKILSHLARGYSVAMRRASASSDSAAKAFFKDKQVQFAQAIVLAGGLQIDALADTETVVPGEPFFVSLKAFTSAKDSVKIKPIALFGPIESTAVVVEAPSSNSAAFVSRENADSNQFYVVTIGGDEKPTQPYWLAERRAGDLFRWSGYDYESSPFENAQLRVGVLVEVDGVEVEIERPVEYRFADDTRGEIRRSVNVVPKVTVELDQPLLVVPFSDKPQTRNLKMGITNHSAKPVAGNASLNVSDNSGTHWSVVPATTQFDLKRSGEKTTVSFDVTIPARTKTGTYQIIGQAAVGESIFSSTMQTISYPHIQTHRIYLPALANVKIFDLKTAPVRIGYIPGSGDRVPEAIRQIGMNVEILSESDIASGDLSRFDVIVVGIRAYQVRPDLVANNKRLLNFANKGGTLIVQYQLQGYSQQNLMPFPAQMGPRVADENAKVTILQQEHPIFNFPNKINDADFAGWVQERNLYNFSTMDAKYTGLLESHDVGEAENKGGLVVADVGKGKYIYCSYSLFRQLPAGVPGAFRLFANMLSFKQNK